MPTPDASSHAASGPTAGAPPTAEHARLAESDDLGSPWRLWGPFVSGRQWGTVREDYSADGDAWASFDFDQSHRRAYRWGEDGIAGFCDRVGFLTFGLAFWNGHDDRLKERLFGLSNGQGNHGEDVKEYWWPLDATPTHSYASTLYRYPQAAFPYARLRDENARRTRDDPEFELADTGVLEGNRFFDVVVAYAKAAPDDICVRITAVNHGPEPADLHIVPQIWFRNTWAWGRDDRRPSLRRRDAVSDTGAARPTGMAVVDAEHAYLGHYVLAAEGAPEVLVCDNDTDAVGLFGAPSNPSPFPKDGVNRAVVGGDRSAVNPEGTGTKAAFWYRFEAVPPERHVHVMLRLRRDDLPEEVFGEPFAAVFEQRQQEADEFYREVLPAVTDTTSLQDARVARAAFAGLLWGMQVYRYSVKEWLEGDPAQPPPPPERAASEPPGRNLSWRHLALADVISMPDHWEYPWFAAWDLAFHCVTLAHVDPLLAKRQLELLCREWAMHPNGQLPAYEWNFGDVNPPVHAWAAWHVYRISGSSDRSFLIRVFSKLLLNFGWWVNRQDEDGSNLFEGGFLGMDNVSLFDRSEPQPAGYRLEQSDATSWAAFFCLSMLRIALELARAEPAWDDLATKFLEHFLAIAEAMETFGSRGVALWDDADGFFYDVLVERDGNQPLRVRSMVGLLPLLAVGVSPGWVAQELPDFTGRLAWLGEHRPELTSALTVRFEGTQKVTLAVVDRDRLVRVLSRILDEGEFLSDHGIRSLSAEYREPYTTSVAGQDVTITYVPGDSDSALFGGNSNWRGPVWFPVNVLLVDAVRAYAQGLGSSPTVELPTGSGRFVTLSEAADELDDRLIRLFRPGADGRRPSAPRDHPTGPLWDRHPTFSECFHGDTGAGLGASHQTGWTALVAHLICNRGEHT